jgi:hypothetical protein
VGGARRYPPNRSLAWERLQRGWSHDEVADQVKRSMRHAGEVDTGLAGNTVRRWEIGERWPEPRFRKHLVLIFGKSASELGLLTSEELEMCPLNELIADLIRRLSSMLGPEMGRVDRQTFLHGLFGAGIAPALSSMGASVDNIEVLAGTLNRATCPDPRAVEAYSDIASKQRTLYWSTPARTLFESALSHTQLGVQLLRGTTGDGHSERLAAAVTESAMLSGRLAFFDIRQPAVAQRAFDIALAASRYANDHGLAAAVFAHMSFIPGFSGDRQLAASLLDTAQRHARYGAGPHLRSWLHCVAAEISARTGDVAASVRHVRQAADSLNTSGDDPVWLDFYDESRLAGFTGYSLLVANRHAEAIAALDTALSGLDQKASKQRAVLLVDLAAAHAPADAERAASLAGEAVEALERDWYGAAYERLASTQEALTGTSYAAELADRVRELPALP